MIVHRMHYIFHNNKKIKTKFPFTPGKLSEILVQIKYRHCKRGTISQKKFIYRRKNWCIYVYTHTCTWYTHLVCAQKLYNWKINSSFAVNRMQNKNQMHEHSKLITQATVY